MPEFSDRHIEELIDAVKDALKKEQSERLRDVYLIGDIEKDSARAVIGLPHPNGRAAMRMLETEGFTNPGYIDIFDGGPTMVGQVNSLQTIAHAQDVTLGSVHDDGGEKHLIACGQRAEFRCTYGLVKRASNEGVSLNRESAERLAIEPGQSFTMVPRA